VVASGAAASASQSRRQWSADSAFSLSRLDEVSCGRTVDIGDITRMLGLAAEESLEATRTLFHSEEPTGMEDLESLIELGRWELQSDEGKAD
jgi:hypothetical protein